MINGEKEEKRKRSRRKLPERRKASMAYGGQTKGKGSTGQ
jgi:hypothetical protein